MQRLIHTLQLNNECDFSNLSVLISMSKPTLLPFWNADTLRATFPSD